MTTIGVLTIQWLFILLSSMIPIHLLSIKKPYNTDFYLVLESIVVIIVFIGIIADLFALCFK